MSAAGRLVLALALLALASGAARAQSADQPPKAAICAACHGPDGNSVTPLVPSLAGQTARYLYLQLRDFQEGRRSNEQMTPVAKTLSRDDVGELATWFAAQRLQPQKFEPDPQKAKLGLAKAEETLCTMCHLGGFAGQNEIPRVAGQRYDYIVKQLSDFKAKRRTNDAGNMTSVAATLSDTDIDNLAQYIAGL